MMRRRFAEPTLRRRLADGPALPAIWCMAGSVAAVEAAWESGAELVVIDMQHGLFDRLALEAAVGAAPPGAPTLVRVEAADFAAIGRALDAGAEGALAPLVETPEAAAEVVRACRFPPGGARSGGGVRPLGDFPAYLDWAGRAVVAGVMIESEAAAARAEEIAATPGLDLLFVGTGDLALSVGGDRERAEAAVARCRRAAEAAGVAAGLFTASAEEAARRAAEGWRLTVAAHDVGTLNAGFSAALKTLGG